MFDFELKIAQSDTEIEQALRLRYEVFKLELGKAQGERDPSGLEKDVYDTFCDHLIVIDKTKNKVIGNYRLLLGSKIDRKIGFYSERFFDIRNIKKLGQTNEILELGRSCIHRDYRSRPVINLLWSGIAKYIKDYKVRYLFGSVRLLTHEVHKVSQTFQFIKERFYAPPELRVFPKPENKFPGLKKNVQIENRRQIFRSLPPLVKGYLRVGVLICGEPALDFNLDAVLIFVLLDTERIPHSYKEHFL